MPARKVVPIVPEPLRIRRIQGSFAGLDHRLAREGILDRLSSVEIALYVFWVLAPEAKDYLSVLVKSELFVERRLQRILDLVATYGKAEVMGAILRALRRLPWRSAPIRYVPGATAGSVYASGP